MVQTLLLPGLDGSPSPHWQHWWAQTDPAARIVEQNCWSRPCPDEWLSVIATALTHRPGAIVVGHSVGAVSAVKLLSRYPQLDVRGVLLVAPAETVCDERIGCFGEIPESPLPVPAIVVASRNDPWMAFSRARALADVWGADLVDMGDAGHVNTEAGFGPWPEGKWLRDRFLTQARHRHLSEQARGTAVPFSRGGQATCRP